MSTKKLKKQEAIRKAKKRRMILIIVATVFSLAIIALIVLAFIQSGQQRVFTDGRQQVILNNNGSFTSRDAHGRTRQGTFTETSDGGLITVSFTEGGTTAIGTIENNVLTIPSEWDDGCRHNPHLPLTRGGD